MGKNSRERHKAKQKAARARQGHEPASGFDPGIFGGYGSPSAYHVAEELISDAVYARHHGSGDVYARCRSKLVGGLGGAAGVQRVNRALLRVLLDEVVGAWERGWQPAELVRVARRELSARHGRLLTDVIAAQMRVYAKATVEAHWQAQVAALGATVWWEHDDHFVDAWTERHGVDRPSGVDHMLEVVHLLRTLPEIASVSALPGSAQPTAQAGDAGSDVDARMLDRIRALLAKAESTDFPEEADAFTTKAQQLMARHSIDHALLATRVGNREEPATRRIGIDNPYEAPKTLLLQVVAEANRCRAVWMKRFGFTTVVGFPPDLDAAELLFTSLLVQATRAMTHTKPEDRYGRSTVRSFRQSFLTAYATRIGERLQAATEDVDRETATTMGARNLLPVLAARSDAVRDAFDTQFPELTSHQTAINNHAGWVSGRAAADRATLHGRQAVSG